MARLIAGLELRYLITHAAGCGVVAASDAHHYSRGGLPCARGVPMA